MKYIKGARIITKTQVLDDYVLGFDNKFTKLLGADEFKETGAGVIDAHGLYAAPGLIDVHIHGSGGKDVMDGTEEALNTISQTIARNGVTSFLATTMTMDRRYITRALDSVKGCIGRSMPGAEVLGAHMEGPFINVRYKGAHDAGYVIPPDWELVKPYLDVIKIITLAPEIDGAIEFIEKLRESEIVVSMGHSESSYDEAIRAVKAGASHCTHLFNAMAGIHHRNPGVAAVALTGDVTCELIADMIHVHKGIFELVRKIKGIDYITLITDCTEAGGMPDGMYSLGGKDITVSEGSARLGDGTLAGSVLSLNRGLYNFYKNTDTKLYEVFRMASANPARELGISKDKGSIAIGADADFFLMDGEFNVKATFVGGRCVWNTGITAVT